MKRTYRAEGWSFFDRIYCITLRDRTDRRSRAHREFVRLGIASRVEFVVVDRHPTHSEQGIYESRLTCLRKGIAAGAACILIFEDDVAFERFDPQVLDESVAFLRQREDWGIFFLGCMVKRSRITESPAVRSIDYACLAHAFAIRRHWAHKLIEKPWQNMAFDVVLRNLDAKTLAVYPMFAFQGDASTDNFRLIGLDRVRRLCGGLRRLQKVNEWYHCNRWPVVFVHAVVLLIIIYFWMIQ